MKRWRIACLVCFVAFQPVLAAHAERYVKDNTLVSTNPGLKVSVVPQLRYIGELDLTVAAPSLDQTKRESHEAKSYVFIHADGDRVKRIFYIQFVVEYLAPWQMLIENVRGDLDFGVCTLADRQYQCAAKLVAWTGNTPVERFISQQGYIAPPCLVAKSLATTDSISGSYAILIMYLEEIAGPVFDCQSWRQESKLSAEQRIYLDQFEQRWMASFEVYPGRRLNLGPSQKSGESVGGDDTSAGARRHSK